MYRFLQVISFQSLIFKKVLYIWMTINFKFNKLNSLQWVSPTLFHSVFFFCRSPHNLLTSFTADFWVLYSVIGKKTISFKVPVIWFNSTSSTETSVPGLFSSKLYGHWEEHRLSCWKSKNLRLSSLMLWERFIQTSLLRARESNIYLSFRQSCLPLVF